jgi:hypothetical protein
MAFGFDGGFCIAEDRDRPRALRAEAMIEPVGVDQSAVASGRGDLAAIRAQITFGPLRARAKSRPRLEDR